MTIQRLALRAGTGRDAVRAGRAPRRPSSCGFENAVRIDRVTASGRAFDLVMLGGGVVWERHALQPAARRLMGSSVRRIKHLGSFACRNVYGRDAGRRGHHTAADALDVAGFALEDGRRITVASHWTGDDERSAILRAFHEPHHATCCSYPGSDYIQPSASKAVARNRQPWPIARLFVKPIS